MERLVDADEIKKAFDPKTWQGEMMIAIVDTLPTAFNVEAVVKELEEAKKVANEETFGKRNGKSILFGFVHGINLAIRVVRWNARFGPNPDINEITKWVCGSMRKGGVK